MPGEFIIRDAAPADADALAAFNIAMARETEGLRLSPAVAQRGVEAVFADPARGFYVVAQAGDASAGAGDIAAALMVTREWSDWRCAEWWWIQSVYVRAEFRRRGLYRKLHEHIAARAAAVDDPKVCGLRLYVERNNAAAQSTYAALGMRETRYKMFEQAFDNASA